MIVNLHARDAFEKGDIGCATGHRVSRATESETPKGSNLVTALQDVKAGMNGWFEDSRSK
jgi:rhodanese-related sulfurtransferase